MKIDIPTWIKAIWATTVNTNRWVKFIATVIVIGLLFIYFTRSKQKPCESCQPYKDQTQQLINALIEVRTGVKALAENTSYYPMDEQPIAMYASYDSTPKKRPTQMQMKAGVMVGKIDSILRSIQQQQRQIKN